MESEFRFKAFISYSHEDRKWSRWLLKSIESYKIPNRLIGRETSRGTVPPRLVPLFRDRNDLPVAESLSAEVKKVLAESEFLIVICSPAAADSKWVNQEIIEFKRSRDESNVLSIIVDGEPFASDQGTENIECFPEALRFRLNQDGQLGSDRLEPIAADIRKGGDGSRLALLKIVAGMTGLRLDEIIQRDSQRKYRRVMAVTVMALLVAVVMGALALAAMQARNDAQAQRAEAEGLIEFMLTDLREKLEPVGRLDVLDAVGKKAIDYYAAQRLWDMPADSIGRRSRAFHLLGEVDRLKGDFPSASKKFAEAMKATKQLLEDQPDEPQAIYDHAQSVFWVGYIDLESGNYEGAARALERYKELSYRLIAADTENLDWRLEAAYADSNLGTLLLEHMERPRDALAKFSAALLNYEIVAKGRPDSRSVQISRADAHAWIADALSITGNLTESLSHRRAQVKIYEKLLMKDPGDQGVLSRDLNAQLAIARLELAIGNVSAAVDLLTSVADTARSLLSHDPENARWRERGARYLFYLADTLLSAGDLPSAEQGLMRGEELVRQIENKGGLELDQKVRLTYLGNLIRARLEFYRLNIDETRSLTGVIIQNLGADYKEKQRSRRTVRILASALILSGLAAEAIGDEARAESQWQDVIDLLEPRIDAVKPETSEQLVRAYTLTGNLDKALALSEELKQRGYAHPRFVGFLSNHFQQ